MSTQVQEALAALLGKALITADGMDHEKWLEQHNLWWASQEEATACHDREMALIREGQRKTDEILRRAIRVGVKEARQQRKRHQELEVLLKAFLERGGNGKH